jgi:lysophospholipase L1-like esterase
LRGPLAALGLLLASASIAQAANPPAVPTHWVRSWGAAMMAPEQFDYYPGLARTFHDVTLRQRVVATLPGRRLRVWFSNQFGTRPLAIGAAHLALADSGPGIVPGTDRELRFSGRAALSVPAGVAVVSDVVELEALAGAALAVSLYLPRSTEGSPSSVHEQGWRFGQVSKPGNFVARAALPVDVQLGSYFYLSGVDVEAPASAGAIVALGDSITDGSGSTPGAGRSWPEALARRLAASDPDRLAVINMGIGGNRLLYARTGASALERIDRDLFALPGVRYLILFEGINDIGGAEWFARPEEEVTAEDLIGALRQLTDRAHQHGMRVIGATLTPSGGSPDRGYDSPSGEAKRQAVNAWIRETNALDGVIDFDKAIRDPTLPSRIKPDYDSGDHLHPGDAGYAAMAECIEAGLFR